MQIKYVQSMLNSNNNSNRQCVGYPYECAAYSRIEQKSNTNLTTTTTTTTYTSYIGAHKYDKLSHTVYTYTLYSILYIYTLHIFRRQPYTVYTI